jgi:lipoteichoic acid synthase
MTRQNIEALLFIEVLLLPLFVKMYSIYTSFTSEYINVFTILIHDSVVLSIIIFLAYFSYIQKYFSKTLRFLALLVFIIYLLDFFILTLFATHLTLNDFVKFIDYAPRFLSQEFKFDFFISILFLAFVVVSILFVIRDFRLYGKKIHGAYMLIFFLIFTLNLNSKDDSYIHSWIYKNFIEYNLEILSQSRNYSDKFIQNFEYEEQNEQIQIKKDHKNIIILMVESLSSYQSNLFSGINNWTPNLDKIAKNNIYFTDFYANGFVTEDAEIAILTGKIPIFAPAIFSNGGGVSFNGFYNIKDSLPYLFKKHGYRSEFITSSDLDFSNTGKWAQSIGFDYIEGSKHKEYDGLPRYHFDAAEDKYLYKRVLSRVEENKNNNFFLFIKTVSSHVPFVNPENNQYDEEQTIRYIDKTIGSFYKQLKEKNFFQNGLLIIVGDHYPTIPVKIEAIKKFGKNKASSMVPMILSFGDIEKHKIDNGFSQVDIYNTLKSNITGQGLIGNWNGNFSNYLDPVPSRYIPFKRADRRGVISIFNKRFETNVLLDGDDTRVLDENVKSPKIEREIINKINHERIFKSNKNIDGFKVKRIAHAGGGLGNQTYTNSYEALSDNVDKGFKYFELDFSFTNDNQLVCLHDWNELGDKLNLNDFKTVVAGKFNYTPCTLDGLSMWMQEHKDAIIVTDVKSDNKKALEQIAKKIKNSRERIIPQIYDPDNFEAIKKMGFNQIIWTLYRYNGTNKDVFNELKKFYGPVAITMPIDRAKNGLGKLLRQKGIPNYTHTINKKEDYNTLIQHLGISEIYTDFLTPEIK